MKGFFTTPYEDEILYSILARYHKRSGNSSITCTIEELFKVKKQTAIVDFPYNLNSLIGNVSKGMNLSVYDIVYNYSLYPLYKPFWSIERGNLIYNLMSGRPTNSIHIKAGVNSNLIQSCRYLRFCPSCLKEDEANYGEPYWHRLHQVPGVCVCPKHNRNILDSGVKVYASNPQYYEAANNDNCSNYSPVQQFSVSSMRKLSAVSNDVDILLKSNLPSREYDWYINTYKNLLSDKGYVSQKGYVFQDNLVSDFIEYYTPELLYSLGIMPDMENKHNWVSMMVRKRKDYPHPIEHLLFLQFLKYPVLEFFNLSHKYVCKSVSQEVDGRYPCLNAAADHYMEPVILKATYSYSRNKNLFMTFPCECGFIYTRKGPDKDESDLYMYSNIIAYGETWERKLRDLLENKGMHLREAAREMNVDLQTVRKQATKLNLNTKWMSNSSKSRFNNAATSKVNPNNNEAKCVYRKKWVSLIKNNEVLSKTALRNLDKKTYYWLNRYDKEWIDKNIPFTKINHQSRTKIDWMQRDALLKYKIEKLVDKLINTDGKPTRITVDKIGKEISKLYLLRNHLDKLPATKELLDSTCESVMEYRVRRIKWAVKKLYDSEGALKAWKVKQFAGLLNVNIPEIEETINKEIDNYLNISQYMLFK